MANRHKVVYVEALTPKANTQPARMYFSDIIDIILTNLNERDSIRRAENSKKMGEDGFNKAAQLSGIADGGLESRLRNAQRSVNEDDSTLKAADLNLIIDTTADLVRTVAPINRVQGKEKCSYWKNDQIVPVDLGKETSEPTNTEVTSVVQNFVTSEDKKIVTKGFSKIDRKILKSICEVDAAPFGSIKNGKFTFIGANITKEFEVVALITSEKFNGNTASSVSQSVNSYVVLNSPISSFPNDMTGVTITFGGKTLPIDKTSFQDTPDRKNCFAPVTSPSGDKYLITSSDSPIKVSIQANADLESAKVQDARICTLEYNVSNPATVCENRSILHGYRLLTQDSKVDTVQTCTNIMRLVEKTVSNPAANFTIDHVNRDETVYASKWALISEYLHQISRALDSYNGWWDDNGYCARTCQVGCQTTCQLSCQHCHSSTCHNQHCGTA